MGDDDDRAAILARRQRFIAIALSGLACTSTETAPSRDARPHSCLKYSIEKRPADPKEERDARPGPCLAVPIEPQDPKIETEARPKACLSVEPTEPPPTPTPCLSAVPKTPPPAKVEKPKPAAPKPAKPVPCLEFAAPPDEEQ